MKKTFEIDAKWILIGVILLSVFITTMIMNTNSDNQSDNFDATTDSIDIDKGDLKISWDRFTHRDVELSGTLTIASSGVYHIMGSLIDQNIIVNTVDGKVKLILDNVEIHNSTGPAIACYAADDLVIELVGENILEDGKAYSSQYDDDVKGAIYSKSDLTFQGDGTLKLTANYQDGIVGKDDVKFNSGAYEISATDDGIRGKDSVYIVDGNFIIDAKGDAIKSTNETTAGKGFVLIENGKLSINAGDDGIHATNQLIIEGGTINIAKSYEGLEAQIVTINGGDISIVSSDDGINAGSSTSSSIASGPAPGAFGSDANCAIVINGGNVYVNSSGDGIDSNGYVYFNGGDVVVDGPTNSGNGALDSGISIIQNGGKVIAVGASGMAENLGSNSNIYNISIYFASTLAANTKVQIKDSSGNTIVTHTSAKTFNHMAVGTPDFIIGESYTIYINDVQYATFTIGSTVTTVGSNPGGFGQPAQNSQPGSRRQ